MLASKSEFNAYSYFNNFSKKITNNTMSGAIEDKVARYQLPNLIVGQWMNKIFSEMPIVKINGNEDELYLELYKDQVFNALAYGTFIAVPMISDDKLIIDYFQMNECKYIEEGGKLTYLTYTLKEYNSKTNSNEKIRYTHKLVNGIYTIEKYFNEKIIDTIIVGTTYLLPKIFRLKTNTLYGSPIYFNSVNWIDEFDFLMNDIFIERKLTEKSIMFPARYIKSESRRGIDKTPLLNNENRQFRIVPGDETSQPIIWQPVYDVSKKLELANVILNHISIDVGFGKKYLSYDTENNGLKTATEVISSKDDMYITKNILDNSIVWDAIYFTYKAYYQLILDFEITEEMLEVIFSDSLIVSDENKAKDVRADFLSGLIDRETCLNKLVELGFYTDEEAKQALNNTSSESITI